MKLTLVNQLISNISFGAHPIQPETTFSEFVPKILEANATKPHVCLLFLHLHETPPMHCLRLFNAWYSMNRVAPAVIADEMLETF
jgi:hypothetical protein